MNIVLIGCVEFSYTSFKHLLTLKDINVVGIITCRKSVFNADFRSLEPLAIEKKIPYFIANGNNQDEIATWLSELKPDVIYCFGWSYLLKEKILKMPRLGVIGYHPAALPKNRGRHPIIWALALGLKETASTFFFMDEEADSGDILSQKTLPIDEGDDALTLYSKLSAVAIEQISEFTLHLKNNDFPRITQDHSKANYWRKRAKIDGQIDWRICSRGIYNLVRALTRPYVGAHCIFGSEEIKIWKTEVVDPQTKDFDNQEPGKVLQVDGLNIVVKSGDGALRIIDHEFKTFPKEGSYL
ncbi:MAG: formyl transferase [Alphaproteobacteria bacterium]|uniref:Formyl transferase n=1 Tax=Candidatus Nitrobium versatile TaxID=2884831 RepID=A0A953J6U0_9BACT|nr:formyl transferase [Candidatus Nitrobium versatile]